MNPKNLIQPHMCLVWSLVCFCWAEPGARADDSASPGPTIELQAAYTGESWRVVSRGERSGTVYLDNIDITLEADIGGFWGWDGLTGGIYILGNSGGSPSGLAGDLQALSNIEAPTAVKVYELWLEQTFAAGAVAMRAGLYDLNSEIDVIETGLLFINSSHGIGFDFSQSGLNGPSIFPTTSVGARLRIAPIESWVTHFVVLDAVPGSLQNETGTHIRWSRSEGVLAALQTALNVDAIELHRTFRLALGGWGYSSAFDALQIEGKPRRDDERNFGFYGLMETLPTPGTLASGHALGGLSAFLRGGWANPRVSVADFYFGAGIVYTGLLPGRDEDRTGLAAAFAHLGRPYRRSLASEGTPADRFELALELTHTWAVAPWLELQPNVQFIVNPGADRDRNDALAVGLRFVVSFGQSV